MSKILLKGVVPQPPSILVKDRKAEMMVRSALHKDWSHTPPVVVVEDWPEDWTVNAVVFTPIHVIGTEDFVSFSIVGDTPLSEIARNTLNTFLNLKRSKGGGDIAYRDLSTALGMSRRQVTNALKELEKAGIGVIRDRHGFDLDIGHWRPDVNKARAYGIEIKEWT